MDNLNTHTISSLYEAFPPAEARRLAKRLEIHYTPKHGSWLNIAEIELSAMTRQCLSRRIASITSLEAKLSAWEINSFLICSLTISLSLVNIVILFNKLAY